MVAITAAFAITAVVTAALIFRFVREEVHRTNILDLGGVSFQPTEKPDNLGVVTPQQENPETSPLLDVPDWDGGSRVNVLIMGLDYRDWEANSGPPRSDTMIVLTIDPVTQTGGMLSIPRDLWVNIPGFEPSKINDAYAFGEGARLPGGGPELATRTVEEFLGININYYAQVDFYTFIAFIDYIGGICLDVQEPIELEVIGKPVDVKLEPGEACMKGDLLLAYIRNRSTGDGDFGRAARQQQVLIAIRDKLVHPRAQRILLSDPYGLWEIFSQGIRTNIPPDDAIRLGTLAMKINPAAIERKVIAPPDHVIPETLPNGQYVLKPITANIRILRDELFTSSQAAGVTLGLDAAQLMEAEDAKIAVYNGSTVSGLAGSTQEFLLGLGVNVVEIGNFNQVPATTIYDYTGNPYTIKYLVELMGIQNARIFNSYDPASQVDVAVVVGSEWAPPP